MNVIFVEPFFPANQRRFVLALASVGANVIGVGEYDEAHFDDELRSALGGYYRVGSVVDVDAMTEAVRVIQSKVYVDRLEAVIEAHTLTAAEVREATGIPGTSVRTTWLCRDKPSMKQALRQAGVPTAASTGAETAEQVRDFAAWNGYPLILKPRAAAGAQDTFRVDSDTDLERALEVFAAHGSLSVAVEEFVEGHEGFYDTITVGGHVAYDWATHYYPNVLEAMRTRWISPQFITTNRIDDSPFYREVRDLGRKVVATLGIDTSATHMEWFYGPKGLRFSEIGCRPPGVGCWDLYAASNDTDVYREWAHAIVHGSVSAPQRRPYSAGLVAIRPDADGTIQGYSGYDEIAGRYAAWLLDAHLPGPGTPTQPVEAGFMANAWIRLRHPDYDVLRDMLDDVGRTVHCYAG
ncbi:MAG: ATPase [Candidatus Lutibacillus vidarii]|nr:ATP-grasp domain-containing protein [Candidatus Lutibacillus vidarii]HON74323.1 ATP-grasp domain-containing protein [Dermatophilaceae bacterium]HRB99790.1 ATP-grasp domain-containing protein [Dermatophilaceae bacterium]